MYASIANDHGDVFTMQLHNQDHQVVLNSNQLGHMTDIDHAFIRFPEIFTNDMDDLAALGSGGAPVKSRSGEAHLSLNLDIDKKHVARGGLKGRFDGLSVSAAGIDVQAQGVIGSRMSVDLDNKTAHLMGTYLSLSRVGMQAGDEDVKDWWLRFEAPTFTAWGMPPKRVETRIWVRAKSAEPILKGLAAKDEIASIIPALTNLNNLRVNAAVRWHDDTTDVMLEPIENNVIDVAGRYYGKGKESRMAIVVGGKAVSLGIAHDSSGTSLMPFARDGWLNEKLAAFPRPTEKIRTSQP
jgi:hypothetical protein